MFGMSLSAFTILHVVLSLIGIASGIIVLLGMVTGQKLAGWTLLFLFTTITTSVTGFGFPAGRVMPSHIIGALSLVVLVAAVFARYGRRLAGSWRWIYVVAATLALYLNCFVGVVQAFGKLPFLEPLAPTQSEPAFVVTQLAMLAFFVLFGGIAVWNFHPERTVLAAAR